MRRNTGRRTTISISEKICTDHNLHPAMRRESRIIIHDGYQWQIGNIRNDEELQEVLDFLEISLTDIEHEVEWESTGKVTHYNLSKNINNPCDGGFWNMEQLQGMSEGQTLKKFKGYSNGSIVDCYAGIGDSIVDIYRPNPNAKEVYKPMVLEEHLNYIKNNWTL